MPSIEHLFTVFWSSKNLFIQGMLLTLQLTGVAIFISIFIGLFFALVRLSPSKVLRALSAFYIWMVRGTPLIVQIFVLYFGLTEIVQIPSFWAASLALAFHNGAYIAEIFRGTIESIEKGQYEAGLSLGMTPVLTFKRVILPQAFRRSLPTLGNQFIIALKDSSLAAFISMNELFNVATTQGSNNFDQMTYLLICAFYYLILVLFLSLGVRFLERQTAMT